MADHFDKEQVGNDLNNAFDSNIVFKDKKLNKLWLKAESAGFTGTYQFYLFKLVVQYSNMFVILFQFQRLS